MILVKPIYDIELSQGNRLVKLSGNIWYELKVSKINDIESLQIIIPTLTFPDNVVIIEKVLLNNYFITKEEDRNIKIDNILE
jgi:hypothetical protein